MQNQRLLREERLIENQKQQNPEGIRGWGLCLNQHIGEEIVGAGPADQISIVQMWSLKEEGMEHDLEGGW